MKSNYGSYGTFTTFLDKKHRKTPPKTTKTIMDIVIDNNI